MPPILSVSDRALKVRVGDFEFDVIKKHLFSSGLSSGFASARLPRGVTPHTHARRTRDTTQRRKNRITNVNPC